MNENGERVLLGYCFYDKSEIYEGDSVVTYKGHLYHRANFLQASLDEHGNFVDAEGEE